jgi:hypothetical protein
MAYNPKCITYAGSDIYWHANPTYTCTNIYVYWNRQPDAERDGDVRDSNALHPRPQDSVSQRR